MNTLVDLFAGSASPSIRLWTTLAPALLLSSYFVVGLLVYVVRCVFRGAYHDAEIEARGSSVFAGMWLRLYFGWMMQPLWRVLLRTGIPALAVTTLSLLLGLGSGVALASGRFALGGWLYIFSGICDLLDGRLARMRGETTKMGAVLDSTLDRYSDAAVLVGLAWYYRDSWILAAVLIALVGSSLVPYLRARGEAAGVSVKVGVMQRAERILYLGVACAVSPVVEILVTPSHPHARYPVAVVGIVLLAVTTQLTALQRLIYLLLTLGDAPRPRWIRTGIVRSHVAAAVATLIDFGVMSILVIRHGLKPPVATLIGCFVGAFISYLINRYWTAGSIKPKLPQVGRYTFVSVTSALLNAGGVGVLLLIPPVNCLLAWPLVRTAVFAAWNFPLQREYVYKAPNHSPGTQAARASKV